MLLPLSLVQFSLVQLLNRVWLFATPWITARQASLSIPAPGVYPNSCPLSHRCHPTISSSVIPFSCPQSFPASGSFQMSQLFSSKSQVTPRFVGDYSSDEHQQLFIASSVSSIIVFLTQLKITNIKQAVWIKICCKTLRFCFRITKKQSRCETERNHNLAIFPSYYFLMLLISIKRKTVYLLHPYGIFKILTCSYQGQIKLYCFGLNHSHPSSEPFSK